MLWDVEELKLLITYRCKSTIWPNILDNTLYTGSHIESTAHNVGKVEEYPNRATELRTHGSRQHKVNSATLQNFVKIYFFFKKDNIFLNKDKVFSYSVNILICLRGRKNVALVQQIMSHKNTKYSFSITDFSPKYLNNTSKSNNFIIQLLYSWIIKEEIQSKRRLISKCLLCNIYINKSIIF